jgi:hypothetical protein
LVTGVSGAAASAGTVQPARATAPNTAKKAAVSL